MFKQASLPDVTCAAIDMLTMAIEVMSGSRAWLRKFDVKYLDVKSDRASDADTVWLGISITWRAGIITNLPDVRLALRRTEWFSFPYLPKFVETNYTDSDGVNHLLWIKWEIREGLRDCKSPTVIVAEFNDSGQPLGKCRVGTSYIDRHEEDMLDDMRE